MARGIKLKQATYEIDIFNPVKKTRQVKALCGIKMDEFNIGAGDTSINETTSTVVLIPFNISLRKNFNQIGIHPRYLVCELKLAGATNSACYGTQPKRIVEIPVLTLAQFDKFNAYDKKLGGTQADTLIKVNHSFNGTTKLDYTIIKKVDQRLI